MYLSFKHIVTFLFSEKQNKQEETLVVFKKEPFLENQETETCMAIAALIIRLMSDLIQQVLGLVFYFSVLQELMKSRFAQDWTFVLVPDDLLMYVFKRRCSLCMRVMYVFMHRCTCMYACNTVYVGPIRMFACMHL